MPEPENAVESENAVELALDADIQPDHPEAGLVDTVPATPPSDSELDSMYPGEPPLPQGGRQPEH
jgi:hypothetical protein